MQSGAFMDRLMRVYGVCLIVAFTGLRRLATQIDTPLALHQSWKLCMPVLPFPRAGCCEVPTGEGHNLVY